MYVTILSETTKFNKGLSYWTVFWPKWNTYTTRNEHISANWHTDLNYELDKGRFHLFSGFAIFHFHYNQCNKFASNKNWEEMRGKKSFISIIYMTTLSKKYEMILKWFWNDLKIWAGHLQRISKSLHMNYYERKCPLIFCTKLVI